MKKILHLGGSTQQIPAIVYANEQGYYTVLCDFLPDNPGQNFANKFHCVSTTDKDAILKIAIEEQVEGVVAYASDPAAPTAAYVSEKMGLSTNPLDSISILAYKDKFREFLSANDFNCPKAKSYSSIEEAKSEIESFTFPIMVKPIDSSGSKGVSKVEDIDQFEAAFNNAKDNSRGKKIIIEEFIVQDHEYMVGGDCFVLNGEVAYWGLLNCHRDVSANPLVPVGKSYPLKISKSRLVKIKKEIQKVIDILDIKFGGFNLEVMVTRDDRVFIVEMGPRNGGNMIPDFLKEIHKIDLIGATVETAVNNKDLSLAYEPNDGYYATHNIHSIKDGVFRGIEYKGNLTKNIIKQVIYKKDGDLVQFFDSANKAIGILFLKFETEEDLTDFISNPEKWIEVKVEE